MRIYVEKYARDNVGSIAFNNDFLLDIANEVKKIAEKCNNVDEAFDKIEEFLEECEFGVGQGYEIDEEEGKIVVYDKNIELNSYGGVNCSWGYDEIVIVLLDDEPSMLEALKQVIEKIQDDAIYEVTADISDAGFLYSAFEDFACSEQQEITGEELKRYLRDWVDCVKQIDEENAGFADGMKVNQIPICAQNPYAYGGDSWSFDGDENELTLYASYTVLLGAHYHQSSEYISFKKKS